MLTISKPLTAAQIRSYHAEEFTNARDNYYTEGDRIHGQWHGRLAARWGLAGAVDEEHIGRLADGRHPITNEVLVRHQSPRTYTARSGKTLDAMEHRAGWDMAFSAPKSVSLTALVGGDDRVTEAHRASVRVALDELERFVQARIGGHRPPETTGAWIAATFEHDSARPVDGYAAPQLHTHAVVFNVTERDNTETRALQPRELFKSQQYATAVYRSELAIRLTALGYEIERGANGQPDVRGYTREYLEASSPRRKQIEAHLADMQQTGAEAAHIAAHRTRGAKSDVSHGEMQQRHIALAHAFGDQPTRVVEAAGPRRAQVTTPSEPQITAAAAVQFATERNFEREAVVDERALLRDGLSRSMGELPFRAIKTEFDQQIVTGQLLAREQLPGAAAGAYTTPEMITLELDTIRFIHRGQGTREPLGSDNIRHRVHTAHSNLNADQRGGVEQILGNRDQVQGLEGVAGAGKTTALTAIRDSAEREGYRVHGLAPTSRAAQKLAEAGIVSTTLQAHLAHREDGSDGAPRLFVVDESSLASSRQMNAFLHRLMSHDRVLLVGDVRQHQAVEAGKPYQQMQEAGLQVTRLDHIVRQQDPALKSVVERLSRGEIASAIQQLDQQGRVHDIPNRAARLATIAQAYTTNPQGTLVVSPDNQSRIELNQMIHHLMQRSGHVAGREYKVRALVPRQDMTGADRLWAQQYTLGDLVRFSAGSRTTGLARGEYVRVVDVNRRDNQITVARAGDRVTYDPRRLHGVTVFREAERAFALGDRIQFTAPHRPRRIANRELGTIEKITASGDLTLRLDSGRTLTLNVADHPHLDYGYAVTSHSAQGQTADRVLIHVDTDRLGETLVNRRLAYVAISRGRDDAQIYTDDKTQLARTLGREVSHSSAIEIDGKMEPTGAKRAALGM